MKLREYLIEPWANLFSVVKSRIISTKVEGNRLINSWLKVIPIFESKGLEVTSFAVGYSLSPQLELELSGKTTDFEEDTMEFILKEEKNKIAASVFQSIKSTLALYKRGDSTPTDELLIRLKIGISPEIKVFVGVPKIY